MKKLFQFLMLMLLVSTLSFAQDSLKVQVFENNSIQWGGDSDNQPPVYSTDGNREIMRTFSSDDLDWDFVNDGNISVKLHAICEKQMIDDTTEVDPYLRFAWIYIQPAGGEKIELVRWVTSYGGKAEFTYDATWAAHLFKDDFTLYMKVDTWMGGIGYRNWLDVTFTKDAEANNPIYFKNILNTTLTAENLESEGMGEINVPVDIGDMGFTVLSTGGWLDQHAEKENTIYVDDEMVYSYIPWRDDCEELLPNNPLVQDTAAFIRPRAGWCISDKMAPIAITNDAIKNAMTPGKHEVMYSIDGIAPLDTNDAYGYWNVDLKATGNANPDAANPTKIELVGPTQDSLTFFTQDQKLPLEMEITNDNGDFLYSASAEVSVSSTSEDVLFNNGIDTVWTNPLTVNMKTGARQIWFKTMTAGEFDIDVTDNAGQLSSMGAISIETYYNIARTASADAPEACNWESEAPMHAIDGDLSTKWCDNVGTPPDWMVVNFDEPKELNYFVIQHAGAGGEGYHMNTNKYEIQVHNGTDWEAVASLDENMDDETGNVTRHYLETAVTVDSVRLLILEPEVGGGSVTRIYEFEMYNVDENPITDVPVTNGVLETFHVYNNYPNPFNPSTNIKFFTPKHSKVNIKVYNALGQMVSTLLDGEVARGMHTVKWNARNTHGHKVAGGVYFYTVKLTDTEGNKSIISKKMVLLP